MPRRRGTRGLSLRRFTPKSLGVAIVPALSYESFFGLNERPFSLAPDPKPYFRSRSHAWVFDTLTVELAEREGIALVTGEVGVGKTTLGRAMARHIRRAMPVSVIANPLIAREDLLRLLLDDFDAPPRPRTGAPLETADELRARLARHLCNSDTTRRGAALVIDDAQHLPASLVDDLLALSALTRDGAPALSTILIGHSAAESSDLLPIRALDRAITRRLQLLPLERDEVAPYIEHRLRVAGALSLGMFSPRAIEALYDLSGGVPRLVNLLCERALQDAALQGATRVEPQMLEISAAELHLRRARPRRFRWFGRIG